MEQEYLEGLVMAGMWLYGAIMLLSVVLSIAGAWKIFTKAGEPGWAAIVPIYGFIVFAKVIKKPSWWGLMLCIPLVNILFVIMGYVELAKRFGKGGGFIVGLIFLSPIFLAILGFGSAQYDDSSVETKY